MTLAAGQKAKMAARLGVMRLGASRLGWYQPWIKVFVNGVDHSADTRVASASITDELNHAPNTVSLRCDGFTPTVGMDVKIYSGDVDLSHQLFGGVVLSLTQGYEADKPANVVWDVKCIDYTWLLNRRKVIKKYTSQSATAIVKDLISSFTSGFTSVQVVAGLATIDEITFTNEDVTDAISRVMDRVGGYWYVDYAKDVHAFLSESEAAVSITDADPRGMVHIQQEVHLADVATRVTVRGGGSTAAADIAIAQTTLPIDDDSWYDVAGGIVESGPQRIAYTGVASASKTGSTLGVPLAVPAQIGSVSAGGSSGGMSSLTNFGYAVVYQTARGSTTPGTSRVGTSSATGTMTLSGIPVPSSSEVVAKYLYRTPAGGGTLKLHHLLTLDQTTYDDFSNDGLLGANAPSTNTAIVEGVIAAGSTAVNVEDCAQFNSGGGWAEGPGGQVFLYTGRSVSSGAGNLTGIPASGIGSLTAAMRSGTVKAIPHLTGVTGIVYAINKGDQVNIIVTVNDAAAQTAMATYIGSGDGVHEMFLSDGRWSITEATAQGNAELTLRKDPLVTISFDSRDQTIQSGRNLTITVAAPAISGTFKVQRVTFSDIGLQGPRGWLFPLRHVELSSRRFSFEDLLKNLLRVKDQR